MFAKLLHGLTSTIGRIKQLWTNENVPAEVQTRHDFLDGQGLVPAAPVDTCGVRNNIVRYSIIPSDRCGIRNDIVRYSIIPSDRCGIRNVIVSIEQITT